MQTQTFLQRMWRWLIAPSQEINEPDQRRQATLLSALLLMLIIGGALVEVITIFTTDQPHYTGYWDTLIALSPIAVVYAISRTGRIRLASVLAISLVVAAIYFTVPDPAALAGKPLSQLLGIGLPHAL